MRWVCWQRRGGLSSRQPLQMVRARAVVCDTPWAGYGRGTGNHKARKQIMELT